MGKTSGTSALINDPDRRRAMLLHALKSQAATRLTAMIQLASSEIEVVLQPSMLDADPNLLGVQNGVINLNTGEFRAASREDTSPSSPVSHMTLMQSVRTGTRS